LHDELRVSAIQEAGGREISITSSDRQLDLELENQLLRRLGRLGREVTEQLRFAKTTCPFCGTRTDIVDRFEHAEEEADPDYEVEARASFEVCRRCFYWRWHFLDQEFMLRGGEYCYEYKSYASKLQEFAPSIPEACSVEIAQWLRRRPSYWDDLDPSRLERFIADVYRANYADAEVTHIGRTADGGVDVVMVRASGDRWLIQVKRRRKTSRRKGEGVETLRNLLGAMTLQNARIGAIVSTADHFTYDALRSARRAHEVGYLVHLVDRALLDEMVGSLLPIEPWRQVLSREFELYVNWLTRQLPRNQDGTLAAYVKPTRVNVVTTERRLFRGHSGEVLPLRLASSDFEPQAAIIDDRQISLFSEADIDK
jgi:HJR/Mrr/RecB family endonuclease